MEFDINNVDKQLIINCYDSITDIETFNDNLSYNTFFEKCLITNVPCVITNIATNWDCFKLWTKSSKPDYKYLQEKYGKHKITVYKCDEKYFNSQKTEEDSFANYLDYWRNLKDDSSSKDYLKDWHLKNICPADDFYTVPIYFASDWLNEYLTSKGEDDYRFVYMGPKGTWTPFHADVFQSFSWSVNICGRKKWLFFPPGEENHLRDKFNNLPYNINETTNNRKYFELIQNANEAVFVPSSWHHQVENLEDTISVNHNWINGCNIKTVYRAMEDCLINVRKEIEDCREMDDFEGHCQVVLNSVFGLDYCKFYDFVKFIAMKRVEMLETGGEKCVLFHGHKIGINHVVFDLKAIRKVLNYIIEVDCFKIEASELLLKIEKALINKSLL